MTNTLLKNLQAAEHFQLTLFQLQHLQTLTYRAAFHGDMMSYNKFTKKLDSVFPKYSAEVLSNQLSYNMTLQFAKSVSPTSCVTKFSRDVKKMKVLAKKFDTYFLWLNYYRGAIRTLHLKKKNREAMRICDEAIKYLEKLPHISHKERIGEFLLHKLDNATLAGAYKEGVNCYQKVAIYYEKGSYNQLVALEYYFLLCMHMGKYQQSLKVFLEAERHPKYKQAPLYMKERWT